MANKMNIPDWRAVYKLMVPAFLDTGRRLAVSNEFKRITQSDGNLTERRKQYKDRYGRAYNDPSIDAEYAAIYERAALVDQVTIPGEIAAAFYLRGNGSKGGPRPKPTRKQAIAEAHARSKELRKEGKGPDQARDLAAAEITMKLGILITASDIRSYHKPKPAG
jgi:hypothetical protein